MKKPDLTLITREMAKGNDFELTAEQYKQKTNANFPKSTYYAEKKSAAAQAAEKFGFYIEVIPTKIKFKKKEKGE